jgi:hypothetical protein
MMGLFRNHSPVQAARHAAARACIKRGEGFIYVVDFDGLDVVKIGFSLDPGARLRTLSEQCRHFARPRLLAKTPASMSVERKLHGKLRQHRSGAGPGTEFYSRSILAHPAIRAYRWIWEFPVTPARPRRRAATFPREAA